MRRAVFILILLLHFTTATPNEQQLKDFEKWWQGRAKMGDLQIGQKWSDQLRPGVFATRDVEEDDILFEVAPSQIITRENIRSKQGLTKMADEVFNQYTNDKDNDPGYYELLTVYVLYEKYYNPTSSWKPWLDVLPELEEMDNILTWTFSELKELAGSPLFQRARDRRAESTEHYRWLEENIFDNYKSIFPQKPTMDQYKWAVSVVRSRNSHILIDNVVQSVIIPYYDMFRHAPQDISTGYYVYNPKKLKIEVTSRRSYQKGEEIFAFWGEKCNSELLDFYSFIITDNMFDCVHISDFVLHESDPLFKQKRILFDRSQSSLSKLKIVRQGISSELLRVLRAITISEEELDTVLLLTGVTDEPLSVRSEGAIYNKLADMCRTALRAYPGSIEDDEKKLRDVNITKRKGLAIRVRLAEKKILLNAGIKAMSEAERWANIYKDEQKKDEL